MIEVIRPCGSIGVELKCARLLIMVEVSGLRARIVRAIRYGPPGVELFAIGSGNALRVDVG